MNAPSNVADADHVLRLVPGPGAGTEQGTPMCSKCRVRCDLIDGSVRLPSGCVHT